MSEKLESGMTRREALLAAGGIAVGAALASAGAIATAQAAEEPAAAPKKGHTVPLNWKEVYFTNCPMVSANNID